MQGWEVASICLGCGVAARHEGGTSCELDREAVGGVSPCAGRAVVRSAPKVPPAVRLNAPCTGSVLHATCGGSPTPIVWRCRRRYWRREAPAVFSTSRSARPSPGRPRLTIDEEQRQTPRRQRAGLRGCDRQRPSSRSASITSTTTVGLAEWSRLQLVTSCSTSTSRPACGRPPAAAVALRP
jgi:hypothetical protein